MCCMHTNESFKMRWLFSCESYHGDSGYAKCLCCSERLSCNVEVSTTLKYVPTLQKTSMQKFAAFTSTHALCLRDDDNISCLSTSSQTIIYSQTISHLFFLKLPFCHKGRDKKMPLRGH